MFDSVERAQRLTRRLLRMVERLQRERAKSKRVIRDRNRDDPVYQTVTLACHGRHKGRRVGSRHKWRNGTCLYCGRDKSQVFNQRIAL